VKADSALQRRGSVERYALASFAAQMLLSGCQQMTRYAMLHSLPLRPHCHAADVAFADILRNRRAADGADHFVAWRYRDEHAHRLQSRSQSLSREHGVAKAFRRILIAIRFKGQSQALENSR